MWYDDGNELVVWELAYLVAVLFNEIDNNNISRFYLRVLLFLGLKKSIVADVNPAAIG